MKDPSRPDIDQQAALFRDVMPALWRSLYTKLQEEGFTESQSMELLKAFIAGVASGGKQ